MNVQYRSQKQQDERTVHKSNVSIWMYSTQVKRNKTNVQYTSQKKQGEHTIHKSKVTRWMYSILVVGTVRKVTRLMYNKQVKCYKSNVQ